MQAIKAYLCQRLSANVTYGPESFVRAQPRKSKERPIKAELPREGLEGLPLPASYTLQEVHMVSEAEMRRCNPLPGSAYPKPLILHDGRIAFRPTPTSTLCMFLWLPIGIHLTISRAITFIFLPINVGIEYQYIYIG